MRGCGKRESGCGKGAREGAVFRGVTKWYTEWSAFSLVYEMQGDTELSVVRSHIVVSVCMRVIVSTLQIIWVTCRL